MTQSATPLMKQYWEIKSAHTDKLLFFRMGDFYEMFYDDAVVAAPILGIALTSRNKKALDETPMCGFPHHSVSGPVNKLLEHGFKVALCDQIEDPKFAKGIVKRAVTRILTPGMVFDSDTLDATQSHFLTCVGPLANNSFSVSFADASTGEAFYYESSDLTRLLRLLGFLPVVEILANAEMMARVKLFLGQGALEKDINKYAFTVIEDAPASLSKMSSSDLQPDSLPNSARSLLDYIRSLGGDVVLQVIKPFEKREWQGRLEMSVTTARHLEIFTSYRNEVRGSLFGAIQRTVTSQGARLFRQWLSFPLQNRGAIEARLDEITLWRDSHSLLTMVRNELKNVGDMERRLSRLTTPQCGVRDLLALSESSQKAISILASLQSFLQELSKTQKTRVYDILGLLEIDELGKLSQKLLEIFREDAPLSVRGGHLLKQGIFPVLDELMVLTHDSQSLLMQMEAREREATGISSLKIRYNNVFGYYIEVTNTHKDKAPAHYLRKQTLANAERFCTPELLELEKKILSGQTRRNELEFSIFEDMRNSVLKKSQSYLVLSQIMARLDVMTGLTWLSLEQNYCRPKFVESIDADRISATDSKAVGGLQVCGLRHPVVEQSVDNFVPNNIELEDHECMLLTGPNMAGKSTLMRQVAVLTIMAQMGSYVAAMAAKIPIFDRIFTRIGASDHLTEGLSTFMVEMTETAETLNQAGPRSLVILDEVGRGTATFDGLSLAQAILEHLVTVIKPITFFATHYHELTTLEHDLPAIKNYHMSVSERDGEVNFLHSLARGPALKSYGIYVAELAGLPRDVTRRAKNLLRDIEQSKMVVSSQLSFLDWEPEAERQVAEPTNTKESRRELLLKQEHTQFFEQVAKLSINHLTPMEAMTQLAKLQEQAQGLAK